MRQKLNRLRIPARPLLAWTDWRGAFGVMLMVLLATLPPTLPFVLVSNVRLALRISNAVAIAMLFSLGYAYGRYAHHRPWGWTFSMVVLDGGMVCTPSRSEDESQEVCGRDHVRQANNV